MDLKRQSRVQIPETPLTEPYMITVDRTICSRCGTCVERFRGYCVTSKDGYPEFDPELCNLCRKCASLCPSRAIFVNGIRPSRIEGPHGVTPDNLAEFLRRRRSIKIFDNKAIPRPLVSRIAESANWAPNQNKNIAALIIDDPAIISEIDLKAMDFVKKMDRLLFSFKPLTFLFGLFAKRLDVIKKKMDYDLKVTGHVVKKNAAAVIILTGDPRVPVTSESAPFLLANMILTAESLGIGSCLMDSLKHTLNTGRKLRQKLRLSGRVLGVLLLGYPAEKILNVPDGYAVDVRWNADQESVRRG